MARSAAAVGLLLALFVSVSAGALVTLNTTALAQYCGSSVCSFSWSKLWNNGTAPGNQDAVLLDLTELSEAALQGHYAISTSNFYQFASVAIKTPHTTKNSPALPLLTFTIGGTFSVVEKFSVEGASVRLSAEGNFNAESVVLNGSIFFSSKVQVSFTNFEATGSVVRFIAQLQVTSISVRATEIKFEQKANINSFFGAIDSNVTIASDNSALSGNFTASIVGGSFKNSGVFRFVSATFQNTAVSLTAFLTPYDSIAPFLINFTNCTGKFSIYTPDSKIQVIVSGGVMDLVAPQYSYSVRNSIQIRDNAVLNVFSSYYDSAVSVSTGGTLYLAAGGYNTVNFNSLVFEDNTGTYAFNSTYASLRVNSLYLNDTTLIFDGSYVSNSDYHSTYLIYFQSIRRGTFGERKLTRLVTSNQYIFELEYRTYGVYYNIILQNWSGASWVAIPIIFALSVILAAGLVFVSMLCGRRSGDMGGVDFLGRPAPGGYAPVRSSDGPILN
eukprot:TRINITY_DN3824_c0_g1_i1.p1 TRINITY_DN3824_c0_g1~~TRINITY_DN3824_c0_g1_i1.p1  ORF type:complete len:499 (+),score=74.24 TRINITY_DN3824_c0_g1_i1:66-1562(+)